MPVNSESVPKLLDINSAAAILHISRHTLYRWSSEHRIETIKIGSRLLFDNNTLLEFINQHRIPVES